MILDAPNPIDSETRTEFDFCVSFLSKWATPARVALFNRAAIGEIEWAAVAFNYETYLDRLDEIENSYRVRPVGGVAYKRSPKGAHY